MKKSSVAAALLLAGCLAALSAAPLQAQALQKIRVTVPTPSASFYPLFYGEEKGLFAKEGMTVEVISTNGDGPDVDAVISKSAQFALTTPNRLFSAFEQGRTLKAVMTVTQRMSIDCLINKQVAERLGITVTSPIEKRIAAMKGLTVAGTRPGAFTYVLLEIYARRAGLVPQKDLKLIGVGGPNSMLPALENGQIDIGCTGGTAIDLAVSRGKIVQFTNNVGGGDPAFDDFMFHVVHVHPDTLASDPEMVRKFLRALKASVVSLIDTPTVELLPALKARYGGIEDEILVSSFNTLKQAFRRDGVITPTSVEKAGKFMIEAGVVKTAATFDQIATNDYLPKP